MVKCKDCHYGWTDWILTENDGSVPVTICKYGLMYDRGPEAVVDPFVDRNCVCYKRREERAEVKLVGTIGIWRSTNHRFRGLSIFKKLEKLLEAKDGVK